MAAAASRPSEERPTLLLEELKEKRAELKRSLKLVSRTLKSESKKQKRLIQKGYVPNADESQESRIVGRCGLLWVCCFAVFRVVFFAFAWLFFCLGS